MVVHATKGQYGEDVHPSYALQSSFLVPSSEDRKVVMGEINLEDSVNAPPCDCTACGSCRCTPCK